MAIARINNSITTTASKTKAAILLVLTALVPFHASAQEKIGAGSTSVLYNPLFIGLSIIIVLLLIVIIALAELLKTAAYHKKEQTKSNKGIKMIIALIFLSSVSDSVFAQTTEVSSSLIPGNYYGLGAPLFFLLLGIILFEIFIAWGLYRTSMQLLGITEKKRLAAEVRAKVKQPTFIEKMNASVAIEKEADIMLDHNYDGIRELDNDLPPWWKYGFYLTIVFSVIYLIHYHVTNTGKLQLAEYEDEMLAGKYDADEYRKKAANLVDENNATLLTDEVSLASGKSIYMDNCGACHGRSGEGGVGPNLTDNYWIHKGGIKDIFKTIKFGYPEKGMKAWQQDLSGKQIHEVSSYIKSLANSNPANAKEPQGEPFLDEVMTDSLKTISKDTVAAILKEK
jgi:cytochrome c oxidase cbb3-type subunit 3